MTTRKDGRGIKSRQNDEYLRNVVTWDQRTLQATGIYCSICYAVDSEANDHVADSFDVTHDIGLHLCAQDGSVFAAIFLSPDAANALIGGLRENIERLNKGNAGTEAAIAAGKTNDRLSRDYSIPTDETYLTVHSRDQRKGRPA